MRVLRKLKKGIPLSKAKDETLFSDIIVMKYQVIGEKIKLYQELADRIDHYYDRIENIYKEASTYEN